MYLNENKMPKTADDTKRHYASVEPVRKYSSEQVRFGSPTKNKVYVLKRAHCDFDTFLSKKD